MPIAWRTDYAMRIMYETACLGEGGQANVGQLAERAGVPYDFARQIANKLTHEGLLMSRRGFQRGLLARSFGTGDHHAGYLPRDGGEADHVSVRSR